MAGPTYEDVCKVLDARERRTDDVSERDYEAHQRRKEEERSTLPEVRAQVRRRVEDMAGVPRWGRIDTKTKPAGAIRVLSLNPNGLPQWSRKNYKADRLKFMVQEYDPDTVGLQELCQNPYASKASLTVADMLRTRESDIRSITSHNKREGRENVGNYKPGGTAVVIRDYLSGYVRASGADHTGLGRWSWYSVTGSDGVCTRFLSGYAPSGSASSGDQTFYKQCLRYIQTKKLRTTPQRMFQDDLLSVIDV